MRIATRRGRRIGVILSTVAALAGAGTGALADDISNNLDASVDAGAEIMPLNVGGTTGSTTLRVIERNGDGKNGCNLTGSTTLTLSVGSSNTAVATVSPSSVTFTSCDDTKILTVTPVAEGSATISVSQTSNTTSGTFNLAPATFTVNVAPPSNTAPQVTVAGVTGGSNYAKGSVPAATCQVTDAEDGSSGFPATLSAVTGPYASDGIGSQTASCSYTDAGGLTASASETYTIVDPTAPVIAKVVDPSTPTGDNGWYTGDVSLDWTVTELESPLSLLLTGCVDQNVTADQAETSYSCSATSAGGSSGPVSVSIKRDGSKPSIDCPAGPSGWQAANVTVNCTAQDVGPSGLATAPSFSLSTNVAEGSQTANAQTGSHQAKDDAGNTESVGPLTFMVDRQKPVVAISCPTGPVILGSSASTSWTADDGSDGSGLISDASGSITLDTSSVGAKTAYAPKAYDAVGNQSAVADCTYSVVYDWSGFFRPVDNLPTLNSVKAGSAVPVKFSLAGNQGLSIFATGYPKSATIPCDSTAPVEGIEETVTAGGSSLTYDATAGHYVYVWKTDKTWAGSCRQLVVKLADGTEHRANFKLMK